MIKKRKTIIGISSFLLILSFTVSASAQLLFYQGFEVDTSSWIDSNSGWYGLVTQVPDGTGGISSSEGSYHAVMDGDSQSGPFSRFGGYRSTWTGDWFAKVDIYLDPSWMEGQGFDYSVAANSSDNQHLRDFIFHVGVVKDYGDIVGNALLVNASNNGDFFTNPYKLVNNNEGNYFIVEEAGWYTLQHHFYDNQGVLAVDLNLLQSGEIVWSATLSNIADTILDKVGGNRYAWFTHIYVPGGIAVDAHELYMTNPNPETKDECRKDGWMVFGFQNQGQCMKLVEKGNDKK